MTTNFVKAAITDISELESHSATVAELQQRLQETQRALDREVARRRQANERVNELHRLILNEHTEPPNDYGDDISTELAVKYAELEARLTATKQGEAEVIERERQHVADLIAKTEALQKQADMELERFQRCCKRNEELEAALREIEHKARNYDYWPPFAVKELADIAKQALAGKDAKK